MEENQVNRIKHRLPFLYKKDRLQFEENVSSLKHLIKTRSVISYLAMDIIYTLIAIYQNEEWKKFILEVFSSFDRPLRVDLFKILCLNVKSDEVDDMIIKFNQLAIETDNNDEDIMRLCFVISSDFVKPTLLSNLKKITVLPGRLINAIGNKAFELVKSSDKKIFVLQRLVDISYLNDTQMGFLLDNLEDPEFTNIILDIFLRSNNKQYITLAESRLNYGIKRYFEVDNNVHYFDIITTNITKTSSDEFINAIDEFITLSRQSLLNMTNAYEFITLLMNSCYSVNDIQLKDCFVLVWSKTRDIAPDKIEELIEYITEVCIDVCNSGTMSNLLLWLKDVGCIEDYVVMNDVFVQKDKILHELYKVYPGDNDIWFDKVRLEKEIRSRFDDLDDTVIKLIVC